MSLTSKPTDLSKRRRFQPPITSFFPTPSDSHSALSHNHYSAATHSPTPVVPAKIQASLLSVGMRVRKSMAEGYKTDHAKVTPTITASVAEEEHKNTTTAAYATQTHSELAPFCGMGKATGYHNLTQTLPYPTPNTTHHHHNNNIVTTDDLDETFSLPPSSQESLSSTSSDSPIPLFPPQKKRTHNDFTTYEDEDQVSDLGDPTYTTTPHSWQDPLRLHPIASTLKQTQAQGRTILFPTINHQRRRFFAAAGKHKSTVATTTMDLDDFEEPVFLRKREEVDGECEVQMGGI
ncbi:ribonucleotide reductase inhibitor-domain-containing protein [Aspergillus cavernicola]|uniref:Ribonucleotide reductase inhibitor-domain-containing protein n=1 Tax=Aspergillus cavernicola TaxID=176166 RepID=A0ABR4I8Q8_9EURO